MLAQLVTLLLMLPSPETEDIQQKFQEALFPLADLVRKGRVLTAQFTHRLLTVGGCPRQVITSPIVRESASENSHRLRRQIHLSQIICPVFGEY